MIHYFWIQGSKFLENSIPNSQFYCKFNRKKSENFKMSKQIILKLVFGISRKFNSFEIIFDSKQPNQRKFPKFWFLGFLGSKVWNEPIEWLSNILRKLNFDESKYFGLKYLPRTSKSNPKNPPSPRWVKLDRPLKQQLSNLDDLSVRDPRTALSGHDYFISAVCGPPWLAFSKFSWSVDRSTFSKISRTFRSVDPCYQSIYE